MRWLWMPLVAGMLAGCSGISDYSPDTGSRSSLTGNQGGTGAQATLWSSDPSHKTVLNQNGSSGPTP
jgi:hypothetical protein